MTFESAPLPGGRSHHGESPRSQHRHQWAESPRHWGLLAFAFGIFLGRAPLLGLYGLYALAWVAAWRVANPQTRRGWWALAGVVTGVGTLLVQGEVWGAAATALGSLLVFALLLPGQFGALGAQAAAAAGGAAVVFLGQGAAPGVPVVLLILAGGLAAVLGRVFIRGLDRLRTGPGQEGAELLLAGVVAALAGLSGIPEQVGLLGHSLPLQRIVAGLVVASSAWLGGP